MRTQIKSGSSDKLISEYPLSKMLGIYLEVWKQFLSKSLATFLFVGVGLLAIQLASAFISMGAVVGVLWSILTFLKEFVFNHPFLTVASILVTAIGLRMVYSKLSPQDKTRPV